MALAILRDQVKGTEVSKKMPAPKKVERLEHWYKEARKVIPSLPDLNTGEWRLENAYVSSRAISWEVVCMKDRQRLYLLIDRSVPAMG